MEQCDYILSQNDSNKRQQELEGWFSCAKCWSIVTIIFLVLHLGLSTYWMVTLGWSINWHFFLESLIISIVPTLFVLVPKLRTNTLLRVLGYVSSAMVIGSLVFAIIQIINFSPRQLFALLFVVYVGLTGSLLSISFVLNMLLDGTIRDILKIYSQPWTNYQVKFDSFPSATLRDMERLCDE